MNNKDALEGIDMNPDYGADYYDGGECEVKDASDYYFEDKPEDTTEVSDANEYYRLES